jgi:hypothetical protein
LMTVPVPLFRPLAVLGACLGGGIVGWVIRRMFRP